ncbi:VOC family protein [Aquamicrobium sp. LC103]|uniref:VOC family protein n=1 Tax=Aquamicrobium sp. LC103 TaxID=1120658 RepID=UPI00063E9E8C|nr:VOC family protein [Aquamicrobium sp. LC103]TKT75341.1 VOC family protein [Aquamicrobium sp. LC103]
MARHLATVAVLVADYDEAIRHYTEVLGFVLVKDTDLGGGKRWVLVAPSPDAPTRLLLAQARGERQSARVGDQTGGRVGFFVETDDFCRDYRLMRARGADFREKPRKEEYGTVAVFADLYGNLFDLIQPSARRS